MSFAIEPAHMHSTPVAGAPLRLSASGIAASVTTTTTTTTITGRGWEFVRK